MNTALAAMLVAGGGAAGSVLRWLAAQWLAPLFPGFPWATVFVNVLGSFLFGLVAWPVYYLGEASREPIRLLVLVGVMGGFTTFSSFSFDLVRLLEAGRWVAALGNAAGQVMVGLLACMLGLQVSKWLLN